MAVKQFLSDETIFYTDDLDGSFDNKVLATANAVSSGIGGADRFLELHYDAETSALDKTWQQIHDAIEDGKVPFYIVSAGNIVTLYQCDTAYKEESAYNVFFHSIILSDGQPYIASVLFIADSANDYPTAD